MAKGNMGALLKQRMAAAQQASELEASDEAYLKLFQAAPPTGQPSIRTLPLDKLGSDQELEKLFLEFLRERAEQQ